MTATLFELAKLFPSDVSEVGGSPSRILETEFRLSLRRRLGAVEAALDVARPRVPDRLGVGLRPYEAGDTLRSLSRSHLLRTGELFTRTDSAAGRQRARILFLFGKGMEFRSPDAVANKAQVAMAAAAILECAHLGWGHSVRFHRVEGLEALRQALRFRSEHVYVITDSLERSEGVEGAGTALLSTLSDAGVRRAALWVVRDPWEQPVGNPLGKRGARLVDFSSEAMADTRFSGEKYVRNLGEQLAVFQARARDLGHEPRLVTGQLGVEALVDALCAFSGGRRRS